MRKILWSFVLLVACHTSGEHNTTTDRWSDERHWSVLEAQEHRDVQKLCALLKDADPVLREAAALAFASVQDSSGAPCLLNALGDSSGAVRSTAAFALGFIADSLALTKLNLAADIEADTAVARIMFEAAFRSELALNKHDAIWLISYLESNDRDIRSRTAQKLARLPKEELAAIADGVMHAIGVERDPVVRMFLVGALKHNATPEVTNTLKSVAVNDSLPMIRIAALRALGSKLDDELTGFFLDRLGDTDGAVRNTALEQIERLPGPLNGFAIRVVAQQIPDSSIKIHLLGLAMRHGDEEARLVCGKLIKEMPQREMPPYLRASWTRVRWWDSDTTRQIMIGDRPAVVRQAAMDTWLDHFAEVLKTTDVTKTMRDKVHATFMREALTSGDAGLIASACEKITEEDQGYLRELLDEKTTRAIRAHLHPIRDLETLMLLGRAIAKRGGLPPPPHQRPPFNHPIDIAKLRTLEQGQQYRIVTSKGEIIIATDVNECPGSSLAFDSLVTAGYYNGKYFHRVIPNFVVQGGCPRGDGYGGMPWTLRTEIGRSLFTAGSVGLASAGPDTESCQFFITHTATPHLDGHYTRFGGVVSGMDVVWKLQVGDVMGRVERME